ncbi:unnamed protein product [Caenorhabditis auriculariae]|uniref:Uncharacterized protein n=1 Tax=Caenorhabditis auriculariae TaxID=2777116 RepID=A0A8S1H2F3_9PELO|nr:unnamed protein product [Caenorhabditis auriculariae]
MYNKKVGFFDLLWLLGSPLAPSHSPGSTSARQTFYGLSSKYRSIHTPPASNICSSSPVQRFPDFFSKAEMNYNYVNLFMNRQNLDELLEEEFLFLFLKEKEVVECQFFPAGTDTIGLWRVDIKTREHKNFQLFKLDKETIFEKLRKINSIGTVLNTDEQNLLTTTRVRTFPSESFSTSLTQAMVTKLVSREGFAIQNMEINTKARAIFTFEPRAQKWSIELLGSQDAVADARKELERLLNAKVEQQMTAQEKREADRVAMEREAKLEAERQYELRLARQEAEIQETMRRWAAEIWGRNVGPREPHQPGL